MSAEGEKFDFHPNMEGFWANLDNQAIMTSILHSATKSFQVLNPEVRSFQDYIDIFTTHWLRLKGEVESVAAKHGFVPCENLQHIPKEQHANLAILALTLNGSFLLLGNGVLGHQGGSGTYERISLRADTDTPEKTKTLRGVKIPLPERGKVLRISNMKGITKTSALHKLFYSDRPLNDDDKLRLEEDLEESMCDFTVAIKSPEEGTEIDAKPNTPNELPLEAPKELPQQQPLEL